MQMIICGLFFAVIIRTFVTGEDIRLIKGPHRLRGQLQVLIDGIWSYACFSNWTWANTRAMCLMLTNHYSSMESTPSEESETCLYNITCSGNELSIYECMKGFSYRSCLFSERVAVRCVADKVMTSSASLHGNGVRLVDGYNVNEGKVEISVNSEWSWVANTNNSWGNKEANVICRMLGYRSNNATGFQTPTVTEVRCLGDETTFQRCSFKKTNSCASNEHVFLLCDCEYKDCSYGNYLFLRNEYYCDTVLGTCEPGCSPGRYISQSYCYPCRQGTYQPATNMNECYDCPFGTYQNLTGQIACQACHVGQYLNMTASETPCNACAPGTYQDQQGQSSCKQCSIGTYQNKAEQAACIPCELGTYQNSSGKTACIPCEGDNTTARQGSTTQYECYKAISQPDDLPQQANVNIIIVGVTFLAGVIIFQIIWCAMLMRRMGWRSTNSSNTKSDIDQTDLKQIVPGFESANTNDTLNSGRTQDMQVNQREHVNAACLEQEYGYAEVH